MSRSGSDLIIGVGGQDRITSEAWYASSSNRTIGTLQLVTVGGDYNPASSSELTKNQVVDFDFTAITNSFDKAQKRDRDVVWSMAPSLAQSVIATSNTQAVGGDLAFDYATTAPTTGGLGSDMTESAVRAETAAMTGGLQGYTPAPIAPAAPAEPVVDPWVALQAGTELVTSTPPVASSPVLPIESPAADALLFAAIAVSPTTQPNWAPK